MIHTTVCAMKPTVSMVKMVGCDTQNGLFLTENGFSDNPKG